ncbi:MAG: twin-arginine translocation signal domain-containing protein [Proteobacteria bacterium]|nr:twin-arginine translocation signal domain-containing protein [Pseudomonadota bacterium]
MERPIDSLSSSSRILNPDRRMFLKTAALSGCAALITGIPLTTYVISPALKKSSTKQLNSVLMYKFKTLRKEAK